MKEISSLKGRTEQLLESMDHVLSEIPNTFDKMNPRSTEESSHWVASHRVEWSHRIPKMLAQVKGPNGNQKPTFLEFAAWNGLIEYVCMKLKQLSQAEATETASRILFLAMMSKYTFLHLRMRDLNQLFRCGADGGTIFTLSNIHDGRDHEIVGFKVLLEMIVETSMDPAATVDGSSASEALLDYSSLIDEFLNQPIDPGIVAEVIIYVYTEPSRMIHTHIEGKSHYLSTDFHCPHGLVFSIPLALVLENIPGSQKHGLPPGARENTTARVTQITHRRRFYDLSKFQADYLTEACESWFAIRASDSADEQLARVRLRDRFFEICKEFKEFGLHVRTEALYNT